MLEKLDFLVRFWELKARHAAMGQPLTPSEQIELLGLMQLVLHAAAEVPAPFRANGSHRPAACMAAQLIGDGEIVNAEIRGVSANALVVVANARVAAGSRTCLQTADAVRGVEYVLPCQVIWAFGSGPATLALLVDGIPSRTVFCDAPVDRVARPGTPQSPSEPRPSRLSQVSLRIGRRQRLVG